MKACLTWLLILLTVHAPLPCPDLDGECRGTPIESLAEMQAWHVLLLGIQPADDIDRGPIRPSDSEHPVTPDETPFGKLAVVSAVAPSTINPVTVEWIDLASFDLHALVANELRLNGIVPVSRWPQPASSSARRLARLCVWRT